MGDLDVDIISLNARGLRDFAKHRKVFNYMKKITSPRGIIFLQETHSVLKDENVWTNQFGCGKDTVILSHGRLDAKGVLIGFREHVKVKIIEKYIDTSGRYIVLNADINNSLVILVNYYAPNYEAEQVKLFEDLTRIFDQLNISENTKFIWGGNFNLTFDINLDADGGSPKLYITSTSKLLSMMSENDLCDIYRIRNPDNRRFTWRRKTPLKQRRLDFFLISDSLQETVEIVDIIPSIESDHSCILMKVRPVNESTRGRAYWKFNSSMTQDARFVDMLKKEIPFFKKEVAQHTDPIVRWEYLKYKFRAFSRNYAIQKSKERKSQRVALEKKS